MRTNGRLTTTMIDRVSLVKQSTKRSTHSKDDPVHALIHTEANVFRVSRHGGVSLGQRCGFGEREPLLGGHVTVGSEVALARQPVAYSSILAKE